MINRPTRFYSNRQEKSVAKAVGGKQVPNSGAIKFGAGDVTTSDWLIECKTTTKPQTSFSIKKEWLDKNEEEKFSVGKSYSALAFDFGQGVNYYVINERLFKQLMAYLKEEGGETNG